MTQHHYNENAAAPTNELVICHLKTSNVSRTAARGRTQLLLHCSILKKRGGGGSTCLLDYIMKIVIIMFNEPNCS